MADFSEVRQLSQDIGRIPGRVYPQVRATVKRAAQNVKTGARERVSDHPSWKLLANTITYDMHGLAAEIGYEDRGQGELAGIAEFGSKKKAPRPAVIPAANEEAPRFVKALGEVKGWTP